MNNFENKKWRIGLDEALPNDKFTADLGNFSHPVNTSNPDWLNHHKGEITPSVAGEGSHNGKLFIENRIIGSGFGI